MNPKNTLQIPDDPIRIGPRHGYRIEGDHVFINAELQVPPYHSGGEWTLELWATEQPHGQGPLTGVQVARIALELPTPIAPYVHQVDTRTAARLPLQGRAYAMVLALIEHGPGGETTVHAFANYGEPQTFAGPRFDGNVGYSVHGPEVLLEVDAIVNPRVASNLSGTLSLELWAFPESGAATQGVRLAASEIDPVAGQGRVSTIRHRVAFSEPPVGRCQLAMLLCEWTLAHGYVARDRRDFSCVYERSPVEPPTSSPALRPSERLRLVPTAEPDSPAGTEVGSPPSVTIADRGLVSIQTGSVEALSQVKGLNLKLAREIVKARPFSSLADLIRVRGIGQKTIDRLKTLVTL